MGALTLKMNSKGDLCSTSKVVFVCSGFPFVCMLFTRLNLIFMKRLLWQDVPDFPRCSFKKKLLWMSHYSWDFFIFVFLTIPPYKLKPPYWRLCFHAPLSHWETWLAFPPPVGVSVTGYFKGMVIREFLRSVRFWSHTAGICLGVAYPGGRSDDCIKKQIFPSESSGKPDQVCSLRPIPWAAREDVKISFFWRKINVGVSLCRGGRIWHQYW